MVGQQFVGEGRNDDGGGHAVSPFCAIQFFLCLGCPVVLPLCSPCALLGRGVAAGLRVVFRQAGEATNAAEVKCVPEAQPEARIGAVPANRALAIPLLQRRFRLSPLAARFCTFLLDNGGYLLKDSRL